MAAQLPDIDDLLPHRKPMRLVDDILALDENGATTAAVATDQWPFCSGDTIDAIVLVELVAQTAGVHNGWIRIQRHGPDVDRRGWIVGIQEARFLVDSIPIGTRLITRSENRFEYEGFRVVAGDVTVNDETVAEVTLQLLRSEEDEALKNQPHEGDDR